MISISYAILTHNEDESLEKLLTILTAYRDEVDEIVIVDDYSDNENTKSILQSYQNIDRIQIKQRKLQNNFAQQKNYLNSLCRGDYIFNLDADEIPAANLLSNLKQIIVTHPEIELFFVPRINTVSGITDKFITKWSWTINEQKWLNWPDYQARIYKNKSRIQWKHRVHEILTGYDNYLYLPQDINYALVHKKTIEKQIKQNNFYRKLGYIHILFKLISYLKYIFGKTSASP